MRCSELRGDNCRVLEEPNSKTCCYLELGRFPPERYNNSNLIQELFIVKYSPVPEALLAS